MSHIPSRLCLAVLCLTAPLVSQAPEPREFTGLVPLTDLRENAYKGEPGGLYPGDRNTAPEPHLMAGLQLAREIAPLDADGKPSSHGRIVLLSVGMSNTTQEFQSFQKAAAADEALNPQLTIVDGAQGGQAADTTADPSARYWQVAEERLEKHGVTPRQVQVVWMKQAIRRPQKPFPEEARRLQNYLLRTVQNLKEKYPNLKIAYVSSRTYGGYALTPLNPEPHAYESGFAVKWLIADQIAGKPELNYDASKGPAPAPWLAWGPYLWTDGTKGRSDGFLWLPEDVAKDGTHPAPAGREKIGALLLDFLKRDATSRPWFLKRVSSSAAPKAKKFLDAAHSLTARGKW